MGRWASREVGRRAGWEVRGGQEGGGQAGGAGFFEDALLVLNSPSFDSCQTISWNPVHGALRIL